MQLFSSRLIGCRNKRGFSQTELAQQIGVSLRSIQNWESGERQPHGDKLHKLAQALECPIAYLTGEQKVLLVHEESESRYGTKSPTPNASNIKKIMVRQVPVISWVAAGLMNDYQDIQNQMEETLECEIRDENAFALIVEGDSMENEIMAGDRIIFSPNSEPRTNDIVVAKVSEKGVFVKRYHPHGPQGVRLESNKADLYPPMELKRSDLVFIYPAFEIQRRLRR